MWKVGGQSRIKGEDFEVSRIQEESFNSSPIQRDNKTLLLTELFCELLVEARLADWREDHDSQTKKVIVHSGKTLTWYSFRHTYITMRLSAGVPLPTVAANTDTSMKYIQEHYFHYRADESTEILGKGRKIKPAEESLRWIGSS